MIVDHLCKFESRNLVIVVRPYPLREFPPLKFLLFAKLISLLLLFLLARLPSVEIVRVLWVLILCIFIGVFIRVIRLVHIHFSLI